MLTRDAATATALGLTAEPWQHPQIPAGLTPWTDDWANILGRLRIVTERLHTNFEQ